MIILALLINSNVSGMAVIKAILLLHMIFGVTQDGFSIALAEKQISERIKKSVAKNSLNAAQEHEQQLKFFTSDKHRGRLFKQVEARLTSQKFQVFKTEYKNCAKELTDSIITHYSRIYESHGRVFSVDFGNQINIEVDFRKWKQQAFEGLALDTFIEKFGHRYAFTEPNSLYVLGYMNKVPAIKHIPLSEVKDIQVSKKGIEFVIIEKEQGDKTLIYVLDDERIYTFEKMGKLPVLLDFIEHEAGQCPAHFAGIGPLDASDLVVQASPLSKSIQTLYDLVKYDIFFAIYKGRAAFETQIRPEPERKKPQEINLPDMSTEEKIGFAIANAQTETKNEELLGRVINIPKHLTHQKDYVEAVIKSIQNIPASVEVLKYQDEYLKSLEQKVLNNIIGRGFGDAYRSQAINTDQVALNYDDQETNLNKFKASIEETINYLLERAGNMVSNAFVSVNWRLGNKHFLKSEQQLYTELENLYKGTGNYAAIQQKQREIYLSRNRHNAGAIQRYELMTALQPFADKPTEWVSKNADMLWQLQPEAMLLYANFAKVLSIFEMQFGTIEQFGRQMQNPIERFSRIQETFTQILRQYISVNAQSA